MEDGVRRERERENKERKERERKIQRGRDSVSTKTLNNFS